jgi:hypothetical protein
VPQKCGAGLGAPKDDAMNPLHWKRWHLAAWAAVTLAGAVLGMMLGWLRSPFANGTRGLFAAWLHYPMAYWPWLGIGAVVAGLSFYSANLLTGSR